MASLDETLQQIPRPLLVFLILGAALIFFVVNDPLRDECEIQSSLFIKNTTGFLTPEVLKNKNKTTQFPQFNYFRDRCREGNSIGSCEDFLTGLKGLAAELKFFKDKCQIKYVTEHEDFVVQLTQALQIIALVAWGDKPPKGIQDRLGWLTESNLKTFCALRRSYLTVAGEELYTALREKVYRQYPDEWPDTTPLEVRTSDNRPLAYKTQSNPSGSLTKEQVYERSLFSIRCDLYQ